MKILIVEDEFANFIHLAKLLNDDGGIVIEGPIKSVKDVKKYLNNKNLDVCRSYSIRYSTSRWISI